MRRSAILLLLLISVTLLRAQDLVQTAGISSDFHKASIGKIFFTETKVAPGELSGKDILHSYTLTNRSNLYMTVFLGNSITNYLHQLAPHLTADSLVKTGNYQFTVMLDNRTVYQSNLMPGAPQAQHQHTSLAISQPLIDIAHERSSWTQFFWDRFLRNGGDSALTEGKHLLRLEVRPYISLAGNIKTGSLIASGELPLTVYRKPAIDLSKISLNAPLPYNGFALSEDHFDQNKIKALKGNINERVFKNINGVVVIKNGQLLIEEYFNGEDRNSLHDPRSVGKSFASTITGIAIGEGYLKNTNQSLQTFYHLDSFVNNDAAKASTTIKELLTMSSGFDGNDEDENSPGNEENMYPTDNWIRFVLDLPMRPTAPVGTWHYFTAGVVLLGDILNKTVPGGLEKYADDKLFSPLQIKKYEWQYTPQHVPSTAGGIRLSALDFAKYGQLYKNEGNWEGKQLIPKHWISETFTKHKAIPGRKDEYYGYLFWNKSYKMNGKVYETWYCSGNGGNKIFIFRNAPLVVVITSGAYNRYYAHTQVDNMMQEYILPAVLQ